MKKESILLNARGLVRLCRGVYLEGKDLCIHSVKPSLDNARRHATVVTYSNAEHTSKTFFYLEDSDQIEEFTTFLEEQIALQQGGPLSDPNIVKWIK